MTENSLGPAAPADAARARKVDRLGGTIVSKNKTPAGISQAPSGTLDRAAVVTTGIIQLIFRSPTARDLRAQIEALLRDEIHDIRREVMADIRLTGE